MQKLTTTAAILSIVAFAGTASAQCDSQKTASNGQCEMMETTASGQVMRASFNQEAPNIVETAKAAGVFGTLLAAATAADLAEPLMGDGPFTVFAPTDDAFAKLPSGTVESLLKPENKAQLQAILKFHVVSGTLTARDVTLLSGADSLNGQRIGFETTDDGVMVNGSNVVRADIECSNGVIHVIDGVILPESKNIVGVAAGANMFGTLLAAAQAAGLAEPLMGDGPFTVFAPTDDAFAALPAGTVESLLEPANKAKLQAILKYHVIPARVTASTAVTAGRATTLQGQDVVIEIVNGRLQVNNANVIATDIDASNGVVHVIDSVILPE